MRWCRAGGAPVSPRCRWRACVHAALRHTKQGPRRPLTWQSPVPWDWAAGGGKPTSAVSDAGSSPTPHALVGASRTFTVARAHGVCRTRHRHGQRRYARFDNERCRVLGVLYKCAAGAGVPVTGIIEYSCEWRFKSSAAGCADCEGRLQPRTTFDGHGTRTHAQARTGGANVPGIRLHSASWGRHRGQQLCELLVGSKAAIGTVTRRHHLSQSIGLRRPPAGCEYS